MTTHGKKNEMTLTLVEAVETLSNIADLQFDREVGITQQHDLVLNDKDVSYRTVHWFHHKGASATVNMVKETFRVILNYLQDFYKNEYSHVVNDQAVERIKTIMVLVGEAAKKLDKYTNLFHKAHGQSVLESKEYKQLQEFYYNRVAKKVDEGTIGKWILALARKGATSKGTVLSGGPRSNFTKHVFIDLESVKKDTEYELFFLKKEDGTRFFSPRLVRNIKLVSDFGNFIGEGKEEEDPLAGIENWQDRMAYTCAKNIIRSTRSHIEKFYKTAMHSKDRDLVQTVNEALIALMMAGNPRHLSDANSPSQTKKCRDYFHDFQLFLRSSLKSADYQRLIAYQPEKTSKLAHSVLNLIHFLSMAIYTQLTGYQEHLHAIHDLILKASSKLSEGHKDAYKGGMKLWSKLAGDYVAMTKIMKGHASGPINKILVKLEEGECHEFDPILQNNLPSQLYTLYVQESKIQFARWPSPTYQEFIHKANINEEFKAFLYGSAHDHNVNKILLFNFQDRSSWKEHFRSAVVEDLPKHESFEKHIEVVTLPKDTDFYHQLSPYSQENHAEVFLKEFKEQIASENGGFFFPEAIRKVFGKEFISRTLDAIHRIFFSGKNILLREDRLDFIEIFYMFIQLKIIESMKPDTVGFSCKDGLDISSSNAAQLFAFLKLLNQERLSENDQEHMDLMLYGPCLITRERVMIPDRFNRMLSALKTIEGVRDQFGQTGFAKIVQEAFGDLFRTSILKGKVVVQSNKDVF